MLGMLKRAACPGDRRALEAGEGYEGPGVSPDRADAMVWGLPELILQPEQGPPRVRALYHPAGSKKYCLKKLRSGAAACACLRDWPQEMAHGDNYKHFQQ